MFLSDYLYVISYLAAKLGGDCTKCFNKISCGIFGNCFVFSADVSDYEYRVWRYGRIEKVYPDTWRNPEHREIICEGNGENVW